MSAHYSARNASGRLGCAVAVALAVAPLAFAAYGAWSLARWMVGK